MNKKAFGLRPYVLSLVVVILFTFFIFGFVGSFISVRNPNSDIYDAKYKINQSISSLNSSLDSFQVLATDVKKQMGDANPSALDYLFLIFKGAFYIPYSFLAFGFIGIKLMVSVLFTSFGEGLLGIVMGTTLLLILSGLIITLVFMIIRAIRSGDAG
jgi:hypothetical protein